MVIPKATTLELPAMALAHQLTAIKDLFIGAEEKLAVIVAETWGYKSQSELIKSVLRQVLRY
jgi:hypothetical protein